MGIVQGWGAQSGNTTSTSSSCCTQQKNRGQLGGTSAQVRARMLAVYSLGQPAADEATQLINNGLPGVRQCGNIISNALC